VSDFHRVTAKRARQVAKMFDFRYSLEDSDLSVLKDYRGPGYGKPDEGTIEAIRMLGKAEGLVLDPNYTGKSMSGLIGELRAGHVDNKETICFIHSGGLPQVFAHADKFSE
jgi:1-aminocyclopropane-1-carboxylate deaminase/D-cysteine desulfhydrase-like pyridoxal-dependent ACC family enzyme